MTGAAKSLYYDIFLRDTEVKWTDLSRPPRPTVYEGPCRGLGDYSPACRREDLDSISSLFMWDL